jgi:hypothetical protein
VKDVIKKGIKRKGGNCANYDEETRAEIWKYATFNTEMLIQFLYFTKKLKLDKPMSESTVRLIKKAYKQIFTFHPKCKYGLQAKT